MNRQFDEEGCPLPHPYPEVTLAIEATRAMQLCDRALSHAFPTDPTEVVTSQKVLLRAARAILLEVRKMGDCD